MPDFRRHLEFSSALYIFMAAAALCLGLGIRDVAISFVFFIFGSILPDMDWFRPGRGGVSQSFKIASCIITVSSFIILSAYFPARESILYSFVIFILFAVLMAFSGHRRGPVHSVEFGVLYGILSALLCVRFGLLPIYMAFFSSFLGVLSHLYLDRREGSKFSLSVFGK